MNVSSGLSSIFATVTALFAVLAAPPLFGGTLESIFDNDFESGTYVGWSDKVPAECDDLIRNGDETDIDCGGLTCSGCDQGEGCVIDGDCADQAEWPTAYAVCEELACSMGCMGENYDVDGSAANGCEAVDQPLGNHTQETAINLGKVRRTRLSRG